MPRLKNQGTVKVFFSSPFGGMEEEREELTRRYFPQIRHLCNSYGLQFAAVDMRWGITSESSANAQVINICLREIDRSDMFIGFFGQRYGWHGAEDTILQDNFNNAMGRYPWLEHYRDKSVTELEFLHGFLNQPGYLPAALFFRDKSYDDKVREAGMQKGDKKQMFKYTAESEHSGVLMDDLKARVLDNREKSLGVYMDYKTPAEAAEIMFNIIMKYLKETLLADLESQKMTKREELLLQHDNFLTSRCSIFVNKEKYLKALNCQPNASGCDYITVTGEPGSGKSAALCNWIASLKQDKSVNAVVYHFVGFAERSTDVNHILTRLVDEFEYILYQEERPVQEGTEKPEEGTIEETKYLMHQLLSVVEKVIQTGKTPYIVIDGLDKVTAASKVGKILYWLPTEFPLGCTVVVSTLSSDSAEELNNRNYRTIQIEPLTEVAKRDMCVQILQESGKELSPHQLEKIVSAEMTKLPIFLQVTLSELVSFGYFRLLDKKIDELISSESTEDLFGKILSRLEEDYNVPEYPDNLVEQVMCCIYLTRQGVQEFEIKEIFNIPDHVWSPLYFAIEKLTINQSGCIQFGFKEFKLACSIKYLSGPTIKNAYLRNLIDYFKKELEKIDRFTQATETCPRAVLELPWLWLDLGDMEGLADCLANFHVFVHLNRHYQYDLVSLWRHTGYSGRKMTDKLLLTFDKAISVLYTKAAENLSLETAYVPGLEIDWFLREIDVFLNAASFHDCREMVLQRNINLLMDMLNLPKCHPHRQPIKFTLRLLKYKLACVYSQTEKKAERGIQLHQELIDIYTRYGAEYGMNDELLEHISSSYHGISVACNTMLNYNKMIEYCEKAVECYKQMENTALHTFASTWNNLALGHMGSENLEQALEYFDKSIEAYVKNYFGEMPPVIGEIMNNKALCYRKLGKLDAAEDMYKKSLEVKERAFGRDHQIVAMSYLNLGTLELHRQNHQQAKVYYEKALEIYEALDQTWQNPQYVQCWENILAAMTSTYHFEEADEHIMKLLQWRLDDNSMERCLSAMYREMLVYYVREHVHYERAFALGKALLQSVRKDDLQIYAFLDMAVQNLPETYAKDVPEEMTVKYVVDRNPERIDLLGYYAQTYLLPNGDFDEVVFCLNRLHKVNTELGEGVYKLGLQWCSSDDIAHAQCRQKILEEGLKNYPDDLELNLDLAKCFRQQKKNDLAFPHAKKVADSQMDNHMLVLFTAETAALAANFDACRYYAGHVIETNTDEGIKSHAQKLLDMLDTSLESETKEDNNNDTGEGKVPPDVITDQQDGTDAV